MATYYTSPTGLSGGDGSIVDPWNLQTALNESLTSGDTLYLRGGTYFGKFSSSLEGGTVLSYPGEWAKIDGNFTTTLVGGINDSQTTMVLADASNVLVGGANEVWIDDEVITVFSKSGNNITNMARNAEGTTGGAASHSNGATVRLVANHQINISGSDTIYRDFEVTSSLTNRTNIYQKMRGLGVVINTGSNLSLINLIVHDVVTGIFIGSSTSNTLLYGNLAYNNGMKTMAPYGDPPDEPRGTNLYLENESGYSRVYDNIILNGFAGNAQFFGVSGPYVGGDLRRTVFANAGGPVVPDGDNWAPNVIHGTGSDQSPQADATASYFWMPPDANTGNLTFGYSAGFLIGNLTNSIFVGSTNGLEFIPEGGTMTGNTFDTSDEDSRYVLIDAGTAFTWNNNTYYNTEAASGGRFVVSGTGAMTWNAWRSLTGYDASSSISSGRMPATVLVHPNDYQVGRANIFIFTATSPTDIDVDLSTSGLSDGQDFVIKNAFNYFGDDVLTGTYDAGDPIISVPLDGAAATVAIPTGRVVAADTTVPNFAALIVLPTSSAEPGTQPALSNGQPWITGDQAWIF